MNEKTKLSNYIMDNFPANERSLMMRKPIFGIAINDSKYMVKPITSQGRLCCPAYKQWFNMLSRCYSPASLKRRPSYKNSKVCDDWLLFSRFRKWWIDNNIEGWELDKDLLSNLDTYSRENCLYVPRWLNNFTTDSFGSRGEYPIGVFFDKSKGRFTALCRDPRTDKQVNVGGFSCPLDAHAAWKNRKLFIADQLKSQMDKINIRIYPRVLEIIGDSK